MSTNNPTLSLKLLVDKKANKVLFAEAEKEFVDFLFNLLALPVCAVIKLIKPSSMDGCIGNLYESLENLSGAYIQANQNKDSLLNPRISELVPNVPLLSPGTVIKPENQKLYFCPNRHPYVTDQMHTQCPQSSCPYSMSNEVKLVSKDASPPSKGSYVKDLVTYMVTDDLSVSTISMITSITVFNKLNVKDFSVLEEMVVQFGVDEGLELLKTSLQSKAVLTSVFLMNKKVKEDPTTSN